jgi:hypothetical protein
MYWIYDIPTELLGLLFVLASAAFAVAGVFITRRIADRRIPEDAWRKHVRPPDRPGHEIAPRTTPSLPMEVRTWTRW